jgi:pSer/pThr/pTyr-binding forkhead associated (FHA) protein
VGKLVVVQPDGTKGPEVPISRGETAIGRSTNRDALAKDPFLSPQHAVLEFKNNQFWIKDISGLNGVFVRIIEPVELRDGDMIRVGQQLMQFELISEAPPFRRMHQGEETKILGSRTTDTQPWGRLSLINGPETRTVAYGLDSKSTRIGREFGDIVFEDDGFISGEHAELRREDGSVYLEDLGSSNGTYLKIRGRHELVDSDLILMGQQLFQVQLAA